jgi:hypothetical protein
MSHPHTPPKRDCMRVSEKFALHRTHNTTSAVHSDARNHYPRIKHHTPPPKRGNNTPTLPTQSHPPKRGTGLLSQSPIVCLMISLTGNPAPAQPSLSCAPDPHPLQMKGHPTNRSDHRTPTRCGRA